MERRILDLIATVIEHCEGQGEPRPGHPPAETVRVLGIHPVWTAFRSEVIAPRFGCMKLGAEGGSRRMDTS